MTRLLALLRCPRCGGDLAQERERLTCTVCQLGLPEVGRLPWLFADPEARLAEWRGLVLLRLDDLKREEEALKAAQRGTDVAPSALRRLRAQLQAKVEHRKAMESLLEPLLGAEVDGDLDILRVLAGKAAATQSLASYEQNALRDWAWPESDENAQQLALVQDVLARAAGPASPAVMLVAGAGSCRLAYDLHAALCPNTTIAADINPYLLLIGSRMAAGKSIALREFPLAPRSPADAGAVRRLAAPRGRAADGLQLVFADILAAPFAEEAFDVVVAPWLVDILPEDAARVLARLNRLIKPGGILAFTGSTVFRAPDIRGCYGRDELLEQVTATGFAIEAQREDRIPYLCSPGSLQERYETVLTFAARKTAAVQAPPPFQLLPPALRDPTLPVALTAGLQRTRAMHAYYAEVLGLIDGQRSIRQIADELAARHRLDAALLAPAVAQFLAAAYELSAIG